MIAKKYDLAGNLLYIKDNVSGSHLIDYSDFTALGKSKTANYPKPGGISVRTDDTYDSPAARLKTVLTQDNRCGLSY